MPDSNDKGEGNYDIRVTVRGDWVRSSACSAIPQRSFPRLSSGSFAWNTRSRRSPHHVVPPWHQERWPPRNRREARAATPSIHSKIPPPRALPARLEALPWPRAQTRRAKTRMAKETISSYAQVARSRSRPERDIRGAGPVEWIKRRAAAGAASGVGRGDNP